MEIKSADWVETPLRFGTDGNLFGILCRPAGPCQTNIAVVMGSTSGDPHCAGASVDPARRLAAEGIASLRIDFAGIGDSTTPGSSQTHVFETDRRSDIAAAFDALQQLGYRRLAIQGLCSGAYHAFQAAAADPRIGMALLINPPLLQWKTGFPVEFVGLSSRRPVSALRIFGSKDGWKRLLLGQVGFRRWLAWPGVWIDREAAALQRHLARRWAAGRMPMSFVQRNIECMARRTRTLFLFAEGDFGIQEMIQEFGPKPIIPGAIIRIRPGLDHSLTSAEARRIATEDMIAFLKQDWPNPPRAEAQ
jgi:dienelactone hydrolase